MTTKGVISGDRLRRRCCGTGKELLDPTLQRVATTGYLRGVGHRVQILLHREELAATLGRAVHQRGR